MTVALIVANAAVFLHQMTLGPGSGQSFILAFGAVPALVTGRAAAELPIPAPLTILTAMFLHGSLLHLAGNMLFLWIFGDNVEDVMGSFRFLVFYILSGYAAAFLHILTAPDSTLPMVGASGAISGVLGAYLVLFPRTRIVTLVPLGFIWPTVRLPALFFLAYWFFLQIVSGSLDRGSPGGGVAWFAHVGGFLAGLVLVFLFRRRDRLNWYRRFA